MTTPRPPLSDVLPPLICGTAAFNTQYNTDPTRLPTTAIVQRALSHGIRAFDTSPYYGPAESLLGTALSSPSLPRASYHLLTKAGRISASEFNYSARWIRKSVQRSLARLHTPYLDLVFCHDVEFVSPADVLTAVAELRRLRDHGALVRYVGISGYPVPVLCELAELVRRETGEPLDAVMSYANCTLQSSVLPDAAQRLSEAGVSVVLNASPLGMGLLRRQGVPVGAGGDFHPAEEALRARCRAASAFCDARGERLEAVALRFALEAWVREGAGVGSSVAPAGVRKLGVTVVGVSFLAELEEVVQEWREVLAGLEEGGEDAGGGRARSRARRAEVMALARGVRGVLGPWVGYAWPSPGPGSSRTAPQGVEAEEAGVRNKGSRL
ncbi:MAG: hypothetical protein M1829_006876 [Trizodia sp. TS-e1964]|nr:MAG: hypothetical protein M1829_006876 [Trizodia sp. TS-e1964]